VTNDLHIRDADPNKFYGFRRRYYEWIRSNPLAGSMQAGAVLTSQPTPCVYTEKGLGSELTEATGGVGTSPGKDRRELRLDV
jgi:hypothetical protein